MDPLLNDAEVRVLGALIEKEITTPDNYPLTLNALTNACNQLSNRAPVVQYDEATVVGAVETLRRRNLVHQVKRSDSRVTKYRHVMIDAMSLDARELAVMCVLMLRGHQTAGEIRTRASRLFDFASVEEVEGALNGLMGRAPTALVARLPRRPGQKEVRYAQLLSGASTADDNEVTVLERTDVKRAGRQPMTRRAPNPALNRLDALLGEWRVEASVGGQPVSRGTSTIEWLEGGAFLVQRADAEPPLPAAAPEWTTNSPFPTVSIVALDDVSGGFTYAYADARGVRRVYQMSMLDGTWRIWGQAGPEFYQRFEGSFSADATTITGRWERSRDGSQWERDFDLVYRRVG